MDVSEARDPREHTRQVKEHLDHTLEHLKRGVRSVDDPKAQALFETAAEVLKGVRTAVEHYEAGEEAAWR